MPIERSSYLAAVVSAARARGRGNAAAGATACAPPQVLTPESLSIPEQPPRRRLRQLLQNYPP